MAECRKVPDYEIVNIVSKGAFPFEVSLSKLYSDNPRCCSYDKKRFPAARLQVENVKGKLMVFSTGKFVVMGVVSRHETSSLLAVCGPMVRECST